jgi:hypothetical protein
VNVAALKPTIAHGVVSLSPVGQLEQVTPPGPKRGPDCGISRRLPLAYATAATRLHACEQARATPHRLPYVDSCLFRTKSLAGKHSLSGTSTCTLRRHTTLSHRPPLRMHRHLLSIAQQATLGSVMARSLEATECPTSRAYWASSTSSWVRSTNRGVDRWLTISHRQLHHHNRQSQTCWSDQGTSDLPGDCY